jgi:undecaprenyl-diphosphatase
MTDPDRDTDPVSLWRTGRRWAEKALARARPWLGRHVRGLYSAVGLYLLLGLALAALALWGFAGLAEAVAEGETMSFDHAILLWFDAHATRRLTAIALEVSALGNTLVIAVVVLVAAAFLWFTHHRDAVFLLGAAVAGNALLILVLKTAFGRPRPDVVPWRIGHVDGYAFPSGHAMTAMVVYATVAYLVLRLEPPRAVRIFTRSLAAAIILCVGLARVYLGVHYPTDVVAGFAVGFAWATITAFGLRVFRYFRERGDQEVGPARR